MQTLQTKAESLVKSTFLGGPVNDFEAVGRLQLITLLRCGLYPHSKLLDIGCGCLRGGYFLVHYLNRGHYCGIEPHRDMLDIGKWEILGKELIEQKQPRFNTNDQFDFSVFGEKFDFCLARSIWTHASKQQIEVMLDSFVRHSTDKGIFLTSYRPARYQRNDYRGDSWIGRSHQSSKPGMVQHQFEWIKKQGKLRGLLVHELPVDEYNRQLWLIITRLSRTKSHFLSPLIFPSPIVQGNLFNKIASIFKSPLH